MPSFLHMLYTLIAGICLYAGITHLLIALRQFPKMLHLLFSLMSFSFAIASFLKNWIYNADSLENGVLAVQWTLTFEFLFGLFLIWFALAYTRIPEAKPAAMLLSVAFLLIIVLNIFSPTTYQWSEVLGFSNAVTLWAEPYTYISGTPSHWMTFALIAALSVWGLIYYGCVRQYRRGESRPALLLAFSSTCFLIPMILAFLVEYKMSSSIALIHVGYLSFILIMSVNMSDEAIYLEKGLRESKEFNQATLTSLQDHIAVLDRKGTILTVNESWLRFARKNNADSLDRIGPGTNYCKICRQSIIPDDDSTQRALDGITAVLNETSQRFQLEYPCHSPAKQRWFLMTVVPFPAKKAGRS